MEISKNIKVFWNDDHNPAVYPLDTLKYIKEEKNVDYIIVADTGELLYYHPGPGWGLIPDKKECCPFCGKKLEPGKNYYTLKNDYICCDCSSYPYYYNNPIIKGWNDFSGCDYEGAILERQENTGVYDI